MDIEAALSAYERQQEREYELEQIRLQAKRKALEAGAERWAKEFLAIDAEIAADKVHMLDLIDDQMSTSLVAMGFDEVYRLLALDAAGVRYER